MTATKSFLARASNTPIKAGSISGLSEQFIPKIVSILQKLDGAFKIDAVMSDQFGDLPTDDHDYISIELLPKSKEFAGEGHENISFKDLTVLHSVMADLSKLEHTPELNIVDKNPAALCLQVHIKYKFPK